MYLRLISPLRVIIPFSPKKFKVLSDISILPCSLELSNLAAIFTVSPQTSKESELKPAIFNLNP